MKKEERNRRADACLLRCLTAGVLVLGVAAAAAADETVPRKYVVDFLATSGEVVDINDAGQVIGERDVDEGCDPFCIVVPSEAGVWDGRGFTALPMKQPWSWVILEGISADGWIVGTAYSSSDIRGIVWKPNGPGYDIVEIPNLPDTDFTTVTGIDDSNRVIGFANRQFPFAHKGFVWSEAFGITDLTDFGFPSSTPEAISPNGTVAYLLGWYQLDIPGVVHQNTSPPTGFAGPGPYMAINDFGDQVRLITDGHEPVYHPFRYASTGQWQSLGFAGGPTSTHAGGITNNLDVTATLSNFGVVAEGPNMPAQPLGNRLSHAYGGASGYEAGPLNENGQMAARLTIGKAPRLVRLVPAERCLSNCLRVSRLRLLSAFIEDPSKPGSCSGTAHTQSRAVLQVIDENGAAVSGVEITGRFLTEYRHDGVVSGTTDKEGRIVFNHSSAPCTGATTFLVSDAVKPGWNFDRLRGTLQRWVIPE